MDQGWACTWVSKPRCWRRAGFEGQAETAPEKHPRSHVIHPKTSIYTPTHRQAHTHAHRCTGYAHPHLPHTAAHASSDILVPHTHLRTQVPSATFHVLRMSHSCPSTSCHLHTDPRMFTSAGSHTHTRRHTRLPTSHIWGRKEATVTNMHACRLHRGTLSLRLLAHTCAFAHTSTSATRQPQPLPIFWRSLSRLLQAQSHRL